MFLSTENVRSQVNLEFIDFVHFWETMIPYNKHIVLTGMVSMGSLSEAEQIIHE